jgi:NAD(P)-dependent dehydrogenase (short-subunit alcohol dehydrogenase family)
MIEVSSRRRCAGEQNVLKERNMEMGLRGKVALVAAASKGLGKAAAFALAREGVNLAICARHESVEATAEEIRKATGVDVLAVQADVSKADDITSFVSKAAAHFGRIDILVTNAGGPRSGRFDMFNDADWQAAFELTARPAGAALSTSRRRRSSSRWKGCCSQTACVRRLWAWPRHCHLSWPRTIS